MGDSSATCRMDVATGRQGGGGGLVSEDNGNVLNSGSQTEITKLGLLHKESFDSMSNNCYYLKCAAFTSFSDKCQFRDLTDASFVQNS